MKEHVLNPSDRAALQSLVPLAGALGAGTVFGLFFVGRRRASFAVFEAIAIVAVLVSVATTAYWCVALLHRDTAISDQELAETAVPLVVAAVLLILISIVARLRGAAQRITVLLPLVLVAVVATIELASTGASIEPDAAPAVALAIFVGAAGFGALGTVVDRRARQRRRRREHAHLALLAGRGYEPAEARLAVALPRLPDDAAPTFDLWRRGDSSFLDGAGAARLRDIVDRCWGALAEGEARAALGATVLLEAEPGGASRRGDAPTELRLTTLRAGAEPPRHTATLAANGDGLFDVTELVA